MKPGIVTAAIAAPLIVMVAASAAHADGVVTYRVAGSAPVGAGGESAARTAALDEAFKAATADALGVLVAPEARDARASELDAEIVRRARLWVASFKVVTQGAAGASYLVTADVRIDLDKLRGRLRELGVAVAAPAPEARPALLLLRVSTVEGAWATFGVDAGDRVPGAAEAEAALARRGAAVVAAPASGAAPGPGDGLPVSDEVARGYAGDAKANLVVIAGVTQGTPGRVRGTRRDVGALARAWVRVLDVGAGGRVVGEAVVAKGAIGEGAARVADVATRGALIDALAEAWPVRDDGAQMGHGQGQGHGHGAPPVAAQGEVLVRLRGASGVQAEALRAHLAGAQGVKSVSLRRLGAGEVVLAVRGPDARRTAGLVRGAADLGARATVDGDLVEATVSASGGAR